MEHTLASAHEHLTTLRSLETQAAGAKDYDEAAKVAQTNAQLKELLDTVENHVSREKQLAAAHDYDCAEQALRDAEESASALDRFVQELRTQFTTLPTSARPAGASATMPPPPASATMPPPSTAAVIAEPSGDAPLACSAPLRAHVEIGRMSKARCPAHPAHSDLLHLMSSCLSASLGCQNTEKNSHSLYEVFLTLAPADGSGAPYNAEVFSALVQREGREGRPSFGLCVLRNYQHFEWLDGNLRSNSVFSSAMSAAGVRLPSDDRPRRLSDPTSWLAGRPDADARGVALAGYLRQLLALLCSPSAPAGPVAVLVKLFFSNDELFRPVRAALKHNFFRSAPDVLAEALQKTAREGAPPSEAACGVCLMHEHNVLPDVDQWIHVAASRAALTPLAKELSTGEETAERLRSAVSARAAEAARVRALFDEHARTAAEHIEATGGLKVRLDGLRAHAAALEQRQAEAAAVLYQPSGEHDDEARSLGEDLAAREAAHAALRSAHGLVSQVAAESLAACEREAAEAALYAGGTATVDELVLWLSLAQPFPQQGAAWASAPHVAAVQTERAALLTRAIALRRACREHGRQLTAQRGEATALRTRTTEEAARLATLGDCVSGARAMCTETNQLRERERTARAKKLRAVAAHVDASEAALQRLTAAATARGDGAVHLARVEGGGVGEQELVEACSVRQTRSDERRKAREARTRTEKERSEQQRSEAALLFFDQPQEAAAREAETEAHAVSRRSHTDALELCERRHTLVTSERAELARLHAAATEDEAQLRTPAPPHPADGASTGVAALPKTDARGSSHKGEVDTELEALRARLRATEASVGALLPTVRAELQALEKARAAAGTQLGRLEGLRAALAREDEKHAAESAIMADETAAMADGAALLEEKQRSITDALEADTAATATQKSTAQALVAVLAQVLEDACDARDAAAQARGGERAQSTAAAHKRRERQEKRQREIREWHTALEESSGLERRCALLPLATAREADAEGAAEMVALVQRHAAAAEEARASVELAVHEVEERRAAASAGFEAARGRDLKAEAQACDRQRRKQPAGGLFSGALQRETTAAAAFWDGVEAQRATHTELHAALLVAVAEAVSAVERLGARLAAQEAHLRNEAAAIEAARQEGASERARLGDEAEVADAIEREEARRAAELTGELSHTLDEVNGHAAACETLQARLEAARAGAAARDALLPSLDPKAASASLVTQSMEWRRASARLEAITGAAADGDASQARLLLTEASTLRARVATELQGGEAVRASCVSAMKQLAEWASQLDGARSELASCLEGTRSQSAWLASTCERTTDWFKLWRGAPIAEGLTDELSTRGRLRGIAEEIAKQCQALEAQLNGMAEQLEAQPAVGTLVHPIEQLLAFAANDFGPSATAFDSLAEKTECALRERLSSLGLLASSSEMEQPQASDSPTTAALESAPTADAERQLDVAELRRMEDAAVARQDYDEAERIAILLGPMR